jgi:membrane-associated phospholipid phosphatase
MYREFQAGTRTWSTGIFCVLILIASVTIRAQGPGGAPPIAQPSPTPNAKSSPSLERRFFRNILADQRAIWTSPFKIGRGDTRWLAPLGLATASLFATDRHTARELSENGEDQNRLRISRYVSHGGDIYATGGVAAAFYLFGRTTDNARARETGILGAEALIDGGIVSSALKFASQRPRPRVDDASGEFFDGGQSFPSGHAISAWSLATVVAYEYGQRHPLVRVGAYGLAAAVSISRYTGQNHFHSDVLVGSAMGYGIGRYVYRKHHDPDLDTADSDSKGSTTHSKLVPFTSPVYSRASQSYGLALAWSF